jgi:hypothetical protein
MSASPDLAAVRRLCRIAGALRVGELPAAEDSAWLARAVQDYLLTAADGVTLEAALRIAPGPGGVTWWEKSRLDRRDALLRGLHTYHFPDLDAPEAARAILTAYRRYERCQLAHDRRRGASAAMERSLEADLFALYRCGGPPQERRLGDVLNDPEPADGSDVFETV